MTKISSFIISLIFNISRHKRFIMAAALLILLIFVFYLRKIGFLAPENIVLFLKSHPVLSPFLFIFLYVLMMVFLVPAALPMTLAAGFLWGWFLGGILAIFSASLGASIAFLIARYLAADYLNKKFKGKIWSLLKEEVKRNDWKIIVFTRNSQVFPFGITSYFLGLTPISFKKHFWTTTLSIVPGTLAFAALGSYIGDIVLKGKAYNIVNTIFIVSVLITIIVVLWYASRIYGKILNPRLSNSESETEEG